MPGGTFAPARTLNTRRQRLNTRRQRTEYPELVGLYTSVVTRTPERTAALQRLLLLNGSIL
jgi:hypothetical protein